MWLKFRCPLGHTWIQTLNKLTRKKKQTEFCKPCQSVEIKFPSIATEIDMAYSMKHFNISSTLEIQAFSNHKLKFKCAAGHVWITTLFTRTNKAASGKCSVCCSVFVKFPEIGKEIDMTYMKNKYNILSTKAIAAYSHKRLRFKCKEEHMWITPLNSRTRDGFSCPICTHEQR